MVSQILFRATSGYDRFTVANFSSQCKQQQNGNEAMFLDVVPQIEEIIEGSCFINPAICLEAVLDHGARAVIPNKAWEYCWVEEKDNQVWEHATEITGQKTRDGVVMHIRSFRNLHMDTIKWSSHPP